MSKPPPNRLRCGWITYFLDPVHVRRGAKDGKRVLVERPGERVQERVVVLDLRVAREALAEPLEVRVLVDASLEVHDVASLLLITLCADDFDGISFLRHSTSGGCGMLKMQGSYLRP